MRSMTFLVNDRSTGSGPTPSVAVTVTENANGTLSVSLNVVGGVTGDLRGFFFDVANESRIGTLSVTPTSPGFTEFRQGNDNVRDLGNGANMNGLLGSDGGFDAGVEIGKAGTGHGDDYQSFSFTLKSSAGALTLDDFANVDFGVRLNSVGRDSFCGDRDRDGEAKLLETVGRAMDAKDDAGAVTEDAPVSKITGNVFANDLYLKPVHLITAVNGSAANIGDEINGVYGTFRLHLDGSYTYKLDNSRAATQALAAGQQAVETFTYTAKNLDETLFGVSTDSAVVRITVTGAADNDAPVITAAITAGTVTELADHAPGEGSQIHSAVGTVDFKDVNLADSHSVTVAAAAGGYLGTLDASVTNPSTGDGIGQVTWTFQVSDGAIEHLGAGETLTQSYSLTIDDGHGATASREITITITGANDAPVIAAAAATVAISELAIGAPGEGVQVHAVGDSFSFGDIDLSDAHSVSVNPGDSGYLGTLSAAVGDDSTGDGTGQVDWSFQVSDAEIGHLGAGESVTQTYTVAVDDGHGGSAAQDVTVSITGSNDHVFITGGETGGTITEDANSSVSGSLSFTDADLTDVHSAIVSPVSFSPPPFGGFSVSAVSESPSTPEGSVTWTYTVDEALAQSLAEGQTRFETYNITLSDGHGGLAGQNVTVAITGTNDGPDAVNDDLGGATRVAVIGTTNTSFQAAAAQLADSVDFAFQADAVPVSSFSSAEQWAEFLAGYDVVVIGDSGFSDAGQYAASQVFPALRGFVDAGGGVVTTGWFTYSLNNLYGQGFAAAADADYVSPVANGSYTWSTPGQTISLLDPAHPIAGGVASYVVNASHHEQATVIDASATRLATGPTIFGTNTSAIAYDEVGDGLTAYVGGLYLANQSSYAIGSLRSGVYDQILEQAVAWTGRGGTATTGEDDVFTIAASTLLANDTDVDLADVLTIHSVSGTSELGASVSLVGGNVVYDPTQVLQHLSDGQVVTDRFTYTVSDGHGGFDSATVTLTVGGADEPNTPPEIAGESSGQVYEDSVYVARGQLSAIDPDPGATATWSVSSPGSLGSATIDAAGNWSYTLNDTLLQVQQLAQGQTITDTFTVLANDGQGGTDTQEVTIQITGTDDRPVLQPLPPVLTNEDAPPVGGQAIGSDIDNGAVLTWSVSRGSQFGFSTDYQVNLDRFSITKNGVLIFDDGFDAGGPPPQAPNFSNGQAVAYQAAGGYAEAGGDLILSGTRAINFGGAGFNGLLVGQSALLNTDTNQADTVSGLKINHDFTVEGIFDLTLPDANREGYGLQLSDSVNGPLGVGVIGDDQLSLVVRPNNLTGLLSVELLDSNPTTDTATVPGSVLLNPAGGDQIRLRFIHDNETPGLITAQFEYLSGGVAMGPAITVGTARIFGTDTPGGGGDETFTRAGLQAFGLDPFAGTTTLAGSYGTLTIGPTGQWSYNVTNQSLAEGQSALDSFHLRVTDQFGLSSAQPLNITVQGRNDLPLATGGATSGEVTEDGNLLAAGDVTFTDPDLVDFHTASFLFAGSSLGTFTPLGSFSLGPVSESPATADGSVGWTYFLNNDAAQFLAAGETVTETYLVEVRDPSGFGAVQAVTVTIRGADEGGANTPPIAVDDSNAGDPVIEQGVSGPSSVGDPQASGNVLANDLDPDPNPGLHVTEVNGAAVGGIFPTVVSGTYGNLSLGADGQWTYLLDDSSTSTNALRQGEAVFEQFTYTVADSAGATSSATLTVDITGSNDIPFIDPNLGTTGTVLEDNPTTIAEGRLTGLDPDHGATLRFLLNGGTPVADYHFALDQFVLTRTRPGLDANPVQLLNDDFLDNAPPPVSPPYSNGVAAGYGTRGFFTESGGRAYLDGSQAQTTFTYGAPVTMVTNTALALTNTLADPNAGLRSHHAFDVMGRFDALLPQAAGQAYGIEFTDQNTGTGGDDHIQLLVQRGEDGVVRVVLREADALGNSITPIDSIVLGPVGFDDQIALHLTHNPAQPGVITGSFELLDGGSVIQSHTFASTGRIFGTETPGTADDEGFTRAQFLAISPAHDSVRTGIYGTLTLQSDGDWTYALNNGDPDTQALAAGDMVVDSFEAIVFDEFNIGSLGTINVNVFGANDAPVANADAAATSEDTRISIEVRANDVEVDNGDSLQVIGFGPTTHGAAVGLNADGTVWYDPTGSAALQALAAGESLTDSFTYTIRDEGGATSTATVSVTVQGADEGAAGATGEVFEDGSRSASGQLAPDGVDTSAPLAWTVDNPSVVATPDYRFLLDNLQIIRNGTQYFNDDFGNGAPPPNGLPLTGTTTPQISYSVNGTLSENIGRAILDGSFSVPIGAVGSTDPFHGQQATLLTDTSPNLALGLKVDDDFFVEARFDLVLPAGPLEAYGIRLQDSQLNDIVDVRVRSAADGTFNVALRDVDVPGGVQTILASLPLEPLAGENQIVLRLTHFASDPGAIHASFDLLGGAAPRSFSLGPVGQIFGSGTPGNTSDDEVFTRVQIIATAPSDLQNGVYGTLEVGADGQWSYMLANASANVQALAQGERVTDTFTVTVSDGVGGSSSQTVSVDVVGSNDVPVHTGPVVSAFNGGYVVEDGVHQSASGVALASDPDHGTQLHWSVVSNFGGAYSADYLVLLDNLNITKNGAAFFNDEFGNNLPPPNDAPVNFSYLVNGAIAESGGRAVLNGGSAAVQRGVGIDGLTSGHLMSVNSNIDPADMGRGLKSDDDFQVAVRFDLSTPAFGTVYGFQLTDNVSFQLPPDQLGDSIVSVEVANVGGSTVVRLVERDVVGDSVTVVDSMLLTPLADETQIVLRAAHDNANVGVVHAGFDLIGAGGTRSFDFAATGNIFGTGTPDYAGDDEDWTRVQVIALGPDTRPAGSSAQGNYGVMSIDADSGAWSYVLNQDVNLPHGFTIVDTFNVRVVDEFGTSSTRQYNITVAATDDPAPTFPRDFFSANPGPDTWVGSAVNDTIAGGGGSDLLIGLDGADTFDYNSLADGTDTISDFMPGAGGDRLDLHDLLIGFVPGSSNAFDFVRLLEFDIPGLGPSTQVQVNADGIGTDFVAMANLHGTTGLNLGDMLANGNLIL